MKAVVLLSGGLDSSTVLFKALSEGREVYPLSFSYGQTHKTRELISIHKVCEHAKTLWMGTVHEGAQVLIDGLLLNSSLAGIGEIPFGRDYKEMSFGIPNTYVPARNSMFLAIAFGYAETIGADEIWCGLNNVNLVPKEEEEEEEEVEQAEMVEDSNDELTQVKTKFSEALNHIMLCIETLAEAVDVTLPDHEHVEAYGYPDCTMEYLESMQDSLNLGTKRGVQGDPIMIKAPLIDLTKAEIIKMGLSLRLPYELTWSCFVGGDEPCHQCDSCIIREGAFMSLGMNDPLTGLDLY